MEPDERQLDRIARYVDGEEVTLTRDERMLAERTIRDERWLAGPADVELPEPALDRAMGAAAGELARRRRRRIIRFVGAGVAAAAAAAVILAAVTLWQPVTQRPVGGIAAGEDTAPVEVVVAAMNDSLEPDRLDELAEEIAELERETGALASADYSPFADGLEELLGEYDEYPNDTTAR